MIVDSRSLDDFRCVSEWDDFGDDFATANDLACAQ